MVIPSLRVHAFNSAEFADPGVTRHIESGSFAYIQTVGTGCLQAMEFQNLKLDMTLGQTVAGSKVAVINFVAPNLGIISGMSAVDNIRFWLPSASGTAINSPFASLQYTVSGIWIPNPVFASGQGQVVPNTLPSTQNVFRIDGHSALQAYNAANASQYIYLKLFLSQDFPTGTFGICGSGLFRMLLSYDFY